MAFQIWLQYFDSMKHNINLHFNAVSTMNKIRILLIQIGLMIVISSCSGSSSESSSTANVEEMEAIEQDAKKTMDEIEKETKDLENDVDSLLREI